MTAAALSTCIHRGLSLPQTLLYCFSLALVFVGSLYVFIPSRVRQLRRDQATHIKWRATIVLAVAAVCIAVYPSLFYEHSMHREVNPWYRYIGVSASLDDIQLLQDIKVVLHAAMLYLGSFTFYWLHFYHYARILQMEVERRPRNSKEQQQSTVPLGCKLPLLPKPQYMIKSLNRLWIKPTKESLQSFLKDETYRWTILRNMLIAPISEEVIFRACMIAPLLSSQLSPTQVCWIAPLFFGVAHLHHFYEQYRQLPLQKRTKQAILHLIVGLLFQLIYTTLFGAYASHLFVRTGSLLAVIFVHIFCNYMGLPEFSFALPTSGLYCYRWLLWCAYFIGIVLFIKGFDSSWLFPEESKLPPLLF